MRAVRIDTWGGPEVLQLVEDAPDPVAGDDEVLVEVARAGVNFADTHTREDAYVAKYELPLVPGSEVAGTVDGRRVVALCGAGGYAERVAVPAERVFDLPDGLSDESALALLVQGLTAHLLCSYVQPGDTVVVGAAAGGVGSLAIQLARIRGAGRVIALASSEDKRALTLSLGADEAPDGLDGIRDVDVVFEMAGGETFDTLFDALRPFGRMIVCGIASREQNQVRTGKLLKTSRSVIGFWLFHLLARPERLREPLAELFGLAADGRLRVVEGPVYGLSEVRRAHEDLAGRRTSGKLTLDPSR